jgi:hypothetical protein
VKALAHLNRFWLSAWIDFKTVDEDSERNGRISPVCSNGGLKIYAKAKNSNELEVAGTNILDLT